MVDQLKSFYAGKFTFQYHVESRQLVEQFDTDLHNALCFFCEKYEDPMTESFHFLVNILPEYSYDATENLECNIDTIMEEGNDTFERLMTNSSFRTFSRKSLTVFTMNTRPTGGINSVAFWTYIMLSNGFVDVSDVIHIPDKKVFVLPNEASKLIIKMLVANMIT